MYFVINLRGNVYIGTIVPMPPVMGVGKTLFDIPGMQPHIWLQVLLNEPMQECRDVRKSQVYMTYNKKVIVI